WMQWVEFDEQVDPLQSPRMYFSQRVAPSPQRGQTEVGQHNDRRQEEDAEHQIAADPCQQTCKSDVWPPPRLAAFLLSRRTIGWAQIVNVAAIDLGFVHHCLLDPEDRAVVISYLD